MQEQLKLLSETINELDNDPRQSLQYFNLATPHISSNYCSPPPDIRWYMLNSILGSFAVNVLGYTREDAQAFIDKTLEQVHNKYQTNQHLCWKAHEHHFHETFQSYVNCPITCLCELGEFFDKLRRTLYAG